MIQNSLVRRRGRGEMMDVSHFLFVVSQERSFFPLTFSRWSEENVSQRAKMQYER